MHRLEINIEREVKIESLVPDIYMTVVALI
jgi:hypothetical protein